MQPYPMRENNTPISSTCRYRMSMGLGALVNSFILTGILFLPIYISASENKPVNTAVKNILSLDLCTDWMLAKYAEPSQVLALSPLLHQYPVDWMTRKWPSHNGSLEQILELKPDLVITGEYNALMLRHRLQELGIRVEILVLPKNFSEVDHYQQRLLSLTGESNHKIETLSKTSFNDNPKPKLLLLGPNGIGTGHNTFEDDILQRAGWENYLSSEGYSNLDLEQIVTNPPDAILLATQNSAALANLFAKHPVLKQVIPKQRWLSTDSWRWQCPGPWSRDLIKQLHTQLKQQF